MVSRTPPARKTCNAIVVKLALMFPTPPPDRVLSCLQRMDDYEFEHFVAELWERQGWETDVRDTVGFADVVERISFYE